MSTAEIVPVTELGAVHFIGIGGSGMSGIARIMAMNGVSVSGSDAKESAVVDILRALGARVEIGHSADHLGEADTLVVSSAIREDNPELVAARARGLRILHRSGALASLMADSRAVAVAGTHGKTTTTSMTTVALQACGLDPSFVIGGVLSTTGTNAHLGTGDVFVAEADESDGSFLLYEPAIGILTNVEADHLDHYGTAENVRQAFIDFCDGIGRRGGTVIACADDPGSRDVAEHARETGTTVLLYGTAEDADIRIVDLVSGLGSEFSLLVPGRSAPLPVALRQPGAHNARNATAAIAVAHSLGADVERAAAGLAGYGGTRRRFEERGLAAGVRVIDDYAHHPTEVRAVLSAARGVVADEGRVWAIFQPHLYSRTAEFKAEFGQALGLADEVVVLDVFPAREDPVPGVTGNLIAERVPHSHVTFLSSFGDAVPFVAERVRPGDLVLTIGAGDVTILGPEILAALEK
ncbi:UDP-N-acetylmuramate--L-alanine ligase [Brevibacterium casei]|uniref:UDP-N-acetylmuramate--L-alanine ligase n=1 Tax=Brevibacterium casei TaxID=33889 RepID=A0A269Z8V7_9MICO|nr:UDP-N-acetylmuramate--L-alanine ligase [Brevibacterium casei]MCT1551501.1 UDP-N-acetylmuramate--L-alanine ligase [Brevibacterium casei]MCT1560932.1 UDP-N-acetylmuramate--L-alanine ligase [Brevibacterium casei]MCT2209260.1 UDP-N-acetylmuramate--L-alanine ligase [Brevibacterium casei]PAK94233.1 UDP-N-acetylmuramate--L-alanine ligase [Brevibacterium casei]QPS33090.1 UDP-N-acetylmuramate--L-alanine ligase [Brevibacterium casei]